MHKEEGTTADLAAAVGLRAENLFTARRLCCSEAVLLAVSSGLGGGLTEAQAISLGAGFCGGMGEAGCVCGGLAGAVMALGLFLAPSSPGGIDGKQLRLMSRTLHDRFQQQAGAVCCRTLLNGFAGDRKGRHRHCTGLTGLAAKLVMHLLLEARPALQAQADLRFISRRDSRLVGLFRKK